MHELEIDRFVRLETEVWEALVTGDGDADARLLSDDFLGVYPTGFADRADHVGQLADGPTMVEYELSGERLMVVSDAAVLLSYLAEFRRPGADGPGAPETMYVSSLWCRREAGWVNVFSQDTPATPAPA